MTQLSPTALEEAAKAISISTGDEPSKLTYAHEMQCTGRDREPQYRWQYWTEHATAAITAYLAQTKREGSEMTPAATADLLRFVIDHYANQDMNHADFRVYAYQIAQRIVEPTDASN